VAYRYTTSSFNWIFHSYYFFKKKFFFNLINKKKQQSLNPTTLKVTQFKVTFNEEIRRFAFEGNSYNSLVATVKQVYSLLDNCLFVLKYKDPEEDLITISSDIELIEAIHVSNDIVRLIVCSSNSLNFSSPQPPMAKLVPIATFSNIDTSTRNVSPAIQPLSSSINSVATLVYNIPKLNGQDLSNPLALNSTQTSFEDFKKDQIKPGNQLKTFQELKAKWKEEKRNWRSQQNNNTKDMREKVQTMKQQIQQLKKQIQEQKQQIVEQKKENQRMPPEGIMIARFVKDITIPDETQLAGGIPFVKTWRFRNESNKPWPEGARLLFVGKNSDRMGAPDFVPISISIVPKQEIDISVPLVSPIEQGRYTAYFRLADAQGKKFGQRVWCMIRVFKDSSSSDESKGKDKLIINEEDLIKFNVQLTSLHEMQFQNDKLNIRLLNKHKGSLEQVVTVLLRKKNKMDKCAEKAEKKAERK